MPLEQEEWMTKSMFSPSNECNLREKNIQQNQCSRQVPYMPWAWPSEACIIMCSGAAFSRMGYLVHLQLSAKQARRMGNIFCGTRERSCHQRHTWSDEQQSLALSSPTFGMPRMLNRGHEAVDQRGFFVCMKVSDSWPMGVFMFTT